MTCGTRSESKSLKVGGEAKSALQGVSKHSGIAGGSHPVLPGRREVDEVAVGPGAFRLCVSGYRKKQHPLEYKPSCLGFSDVDVLKSLSANRGAGKMRGVLLMLLEEQGFLMLGEGGRNQEQRQVSKGLGVGLRSQ